MKPSRRRTGSGSGSEGRLGTLTHGVDIGVRGIGRSMAEAFEQTAVALAGVVTDPWLVEARQVRIECEAPDPEVLLVDWLNALIDEMAVRRMILARFRVSIEGNQLHGRAWGEKLTWHVTNRPSRSKERPIRTCSSVRIQAAPGWRNAWWMCEGL